MPKLKPHSWHWFVSLAGCPRRPLNTEGHAPDPNLRLRHGYLTLRDDEVGEGKRLSLPSRSHANTACLPLIPDAKSTRTDGTWKEEREREGEHKGQTSGPSLTSQWGVRSGSVVEGRAFNRLWHCPHYTDAPCVTPPVLDPAAVSPSPSRHVDHFTLLYALPQTWTPWLTFSSEDLHTFANVHNLAQLHASPIQNIANSCV